MRRPSQKGKCKTKHLSFPFERGITMKNEILALLGKKYILTTGFDEERSSFVVKVSFRPKSAELEYTRLGARYAQRSILIHDIVYNNTDVHIAAIQSCIGELEAWYEEEVAHGRIEKC